MSHLAAPVVSEAVAASERAEWDGYLARCPSASFYHLYDWKEVNSAALGHRSFYLVARRGEVVTGVLPLTLVSSLLFGRILCSLPFVNFGGPCADDIDSHRALLHAAIAKADELRVDYLELRSPQTLPVDLPVSLHKISMTIGLNADPDVLWNAFTSKHRNNIKRAYKHGLAVRKGGQDLLPVFYEMMEQSWRNLGTPLYRRDYFERILRTFPEHTAIFLCHRNDEPVAVTFNGYFNGTVEGMWAGGGALARQLDANFVLYWEMIRDACLRGCHSFHLGRSTAASGAEDFKRRWNSESQQLHWYYHRPGQPASAALPALNVSNPKYRLAIAAWQRLPLAVTRQLGPPIARLIP
ncbi:FemAB family PEP-CTERM system-associated protein [Steroidobacter sp. S1-65]|uniref:FemAB family PEP-CTERM system-associated protein n=1 Tax=Steroidobacter gossypii TaxID=2805490 RepID=A0ABS1WZ12_9GAMM|nr:FemAB family XrtA/PEP-CTERM system-associated protein [Steroidobacter gossypii]MBM0106218.1 FemAB family PEP-CTERM system-associated protein [Steroidobacter gossypii]